MNLRKVLTLDVSASTMTQSAFDLAVPSGQVVRVNSIRLTTEWQTGSVAAVDSIFVALAARDLVPTVMDLAYIAAHDAILGHAPLLSQEVTLANQTLVRDTYMQVGQETCALEPEVLIGSTGTGTNTGVLSVLFDIDYDLIKLTSKICNKIAVLN